MDIRRSLLWRKIRECKIIATHRRVASQCELLIEEFEASPMHFSQPHKADPFQKPVIWQYWGQGYENVPAVVQECLKSVEKFSGEYTIVRLADDNLSDYLELPAFVQRKRPLFSRAHFTDLLRLMLLKTYGGVWMDATILMTRPIPEDLRDLDFFVYCRDPNELDKHYWSNTYAYYFGWAKGFRVNMLNSFIIAKKGNRTISDLCDLMLLWWYHHDNVPDYFFFQILYDVYHCRETFPLISDTLPHYLQQSQNDSAFKLMKREDILNKIPIHKLTYK